MKLIQIAISIMVILVTLTYADLALAGDPLIFDARKTLPMTDDEPVYHDFYINAGTEAGLKPGVVITVKRRVSLYDTYKNKSPGDLTVEVGKIKVIHSQNGVSVARNYSKLSRKNRPVLDYNYVMIGDIVDLSSASMDRGNKKSKSAAMDTALPTSFRKTLEEAAEFASKSNDPEVESAPLTTQL